MNDIWRIYFIKNELSKLSRREQWILCHKFNVGVKADALWLLAVEIHTKMHKRAFMNYSWNKPYDTERIEKMNAILASRPKLPVKYYWYETAVDTDPERKKMLTITFPGEDDLILNEGPFLLTTTTKTSAFTIKGIIEELWQKNKNKIRIPDDYPKYDINKQALNEWIMAAGAAHESFKPMVKQFSEQIRYISFNEFEPQLLKVMQNAIAIAKTTKRKLIPVIYGRLFQSGIWTLLLCWHLLRDVCDGVEWDTTADSHINAFTDWKNSSQGRSATLFIVIDDAIYSGNFLSKSLVRDFIQGPAWTKGDEILLCIPYIAQTLSTFSNRLLSPFSEHPASDILRTIDTHKKWEMIENSRGRVRFNNLIEPIPLLADVMDAPNLMVHPPLASYISGGTSNTAVYFQHKLSDNISTAQYVLMFGIYNVKNENDDWKYAIIGPLINNCENIDITCDDELAEQYLTGDIYVHETLNEKCVCPKAFYKKLIYEMSDTTNKKLENLKII